MCHHLCSRISAELSQIRGYPLFSAESSDHVHPVFLVSPADLELNGMGYGDKGETPPPLPIKSSMGDYGNLMDNPELASPTTPPPPPPHQRVTHKNIQNQLVVGSVLT